jgi:hypothetical protein
LEDHVDLRSGEGRARILASISREQAGISTVNSELGDGESVLAEASSLASWDSALEGSYSGTLRRGPSALRRCREQLAAATLYIDELESDIASRRKPLQQHDASSLEASRLSAAETAHISHESSAENKSGRRNDERGVPAAVCSRCREKENVGTEKGWTDTSPALPEGSASTVLSRVAVVQALASPAEGIARLNALKLQEDTLRRRKVEQRVERLEQVNKALLQSTTWGLQRLRLIGQVRLSANDTALEMLEICVVVEVLPVSFGFS